ncbi:Na+/melibiose symporter-like transporter [Thermosporothrix hazakensis]|uniref:Na+/melibiose symporter-like transporter n=2 Tax=Thermosporothrix TaxID=768650 RepID=A0A326UBM7_THEHA|nr:MFS transporter [Thermosporothrix hazakensis]PZW34432.1 Na+/melibiose symporter-like transporter [Thermosporothrix hazakensis]BBH85554.1 MFS transporter [Thermosporothrix sp. COM3]GCE46019.1 MFS transporter [Thermosporothrix hazakensis]
MENVAFPTKAASIHPNGQPEALAIPTKRVSIGFLIALTLAQMSLFLCYGGIGSILLPMQIGELDPVNKVSSLGLVTGVAVLLALIGNPLAGALSDRTSSRFGRRRPWIFFGAIVSALALALMMMAKNVAMIFIGWSAFQLCSNFILAALSAIIPDQVPEEQRGTASGIIGLSASIGMVLGSVMVGMIIRNAQTSYLVMLITLLIVLIPFALLMKDKHLPKEYVQSFSLIGFLKNFWINPRKHPDFAWAWLTRFIPFFGYFLTANYMFYFLQDAVHYDKLFPGQGVEQGASQLQIVMMVTSLVFTVLGGILSDRFRSRKLFIVIGCAIMAVPLVVLGTIPSWTVIMIMMGLVGVGFGMYTSVDGALVTQVLPSAENRGKDMGIINIANTLPQSLAPAFASIIINATHSYFMLFLVGAVIALLGTLTVRPIKSVR